MRSTQVQKLATWMYDILVSFNPSLCKNYLLNSKEMGKNYQNISVYKKIKKGNKLKKKKKKFREPLLWVIIYYNYFFNKKEIKIGFLIFRSIKDI